MFAFPRAHDFWRRSAEAQERAFDAFRSVGAKWVFADTVPKWAATAGWQVAGKFDDEMYRVRPGDQPYVYFRKLAN
jgi:hypothetical protein